MGTNFSLDRQQHPVADCMVDIRPQPGVQKTRLVRPPGTVRWTGLLAVFLVIGAACGTAEGPEATATISDTADPGTTPSAEPVATLEATAAFTLSPPPTLIPTESPTLALDSAPTRVSRPTPTRVVAPTTRLGSRSTPTPVATPFLTPTAFAIPTPTAIPRPTPTPLPTPTRTPFVPRTRVVSVAPTSTPFAPTRTPVIAPTTAPVIPTTAPSASGASTTATATLSFAVTQAGLPSEVYLDIRVQAGTTVTATLNGPGIVGSAEQTADAGTSGQVRLTWSIDAFGGYTVNGTAGTSSFVDSIELQ